MLLTDHDDDTLLDELRRVFAAADPPPATLPDAARSLFEWRTAVADRAPLAFDSAVDEPGTGERRLLVFEGRHLTIELEVLPAPGGASLLVGQLVPSQPAQVTLRHGDELVACNADERGWFSLRAVGGGRVSVSCRLDAPARGGRLVQTPWVSI